LGTTSGIRFDLLREILTPAPVEQKRGLTMKYKHIVEYDKTTNKIIIHRQFESGEMHLYTELPLA